MCFLTGVRAWGRPQRLRRPVPLDQSVIRPPSRCPHCETPIKWYDNVPILGWVQLGGKCRNCRAPISVVYPAVELAVALGWLLAALQFGPTFTAVRVAAFGTIMLGIAITDARHYIIPDGFTVFGLLFVLVTAVVSGLRGETTPRDAGTVVGLRRRRASPSGALGVSCLKERWDLAT